MGRKWLVREVVVKEMMVKERLQCKAFRRRKLGVNVEEIEVNDVRFYRGSIFPGSRQYQF